MRTNEFHSFGLGAILRRLSLAVCLAGVASVSSCTSMISKLSNLAMMNEFSDLGELSSSRGLQDKEQVRAIYTLDDVHRIDLSTILDCEVYISDTPRIEVIAPNDQRLADLLYKTEQGKLIIYDRRIKDKQHGAKHAKDSLKYSLAINLYLPKLDHIESSGKSRLAFFSPLEADKVILDCSGASDITGLDVRSRQLDLDISGATSVSNAKVQVGELILDMSGAGNIVLTGEANMIDADMSGAVNLDLMELKARSVSIDASGAGSAKVYATDKLDCDASGAVSINYYGSPKVEQISKSGMVSINKH